MVGFAYPGPLTSKERGLNWSGNRGWMRIFSPQRHKDTRVYELPLTLGPLPRGVGGLLATVIHTGTNAGTYFAMYDGNGNVVGYVRAADGAVVAQYEYGPFGELVRATGPLARSFNFLFSTKYFDWETGLSYYGYRYYSPTQGRWLSRDPIGERGGANLYGIVDNNPVNHFDAFGLQAAPLHVPLQPGPPIIVLPPSGVPPPNIIPFPLLPKPIGPPQVAACIVVALAGWEVGYAIGDKTGLHSWLGDKLAQCLCRDKKFKTETCRKIKDWSDPETGRRFCVFRCDYSEERITREGADCDKDRFFRVVPDE